LHKHRSAREDILMTNKTIKLTWTDVQSKNSHQIITELPVTIGRLKSKNSLVLPSKMVSAKHARLSLTEDQLWLEDLNSKNGTLLNGEPVSRKTVIQPSDKILAGPYLIEFDLLSRADQGLPALFQPEIVNEHQLKAVYPTAESRFLTVGGGLGSFTWVDTLVVSGVNPADITAIGMESKPYGRYQRLCANSQIPDHERLRSNSDSCPDNMWGWPGYAVREIGRETARGRLGTAFGVAWQIFNEPYVQTYTPIAADVFNSIDKEAQRIGWDKILQQGRVRAIRKTDRGRYAVLYSAKSKDQTGRSVSIVYYCNWLHIAIGYPGIKLLKQLQDYRDTTQDFHRLVNAYEQHEHVYNTLKEHGGTVVVRGRGIVASRIIQRISEIRQETGREFGKQIKLIHLMRSSKDTGQRFKLGKRQVEHNWEFQPFNWPKAAWGGDLRVTLERAGDDKRDTLLDQWGGTTTADRDDWKQMIETGLAEGWYEIQFDNISKVEAAHPEVGPIAIYLKDEGCKGSDEKPSEEIMAHPPPFTPTQNSCGGNVLLANFIIDATGLDSDIQSHSLLHDLVGRYQLPLNPKGRLHVSNQFELEVLRHGQSRIYASGVCTLGGPYAPVDSFLGLQYSAQQSISHLAKHSESGVRQLRGLKSLYQWTRWVRGVQP
jgi:pSer/pThr/pTyr-binding forkhead associated (FHA) protein